MSPVIDLLLDEDLAKLSPAARIWLIVLSAFADDNGSGRAVFASLAPKLFPGRESESLAAVRELELSGAVELSGNPDYSFKLNGVIHRLSTGYPQVERHSSTVRTGVVGNPSDSGHMPYACHIRINPNGFLELLEKQKNQGGSGGGDNQAEAGTGLKTREAPQASLPLLAFPVGSEMAGNEKRPVQSKPGASEDKPAPRQRRRTPPVSAEAAEVAKHLLRSIQQHTPDTVADVNASNRWAVDIDRMIRLDSRNPNEIRDVIYFIHRHSQGEFWRPNIRSGKKLRLHYETIREQMRRSMAGRKSHSRNSAIIAQARKEMEECKTNS